MTNLRDIGSALKRWWSKEGSDVPVAIEACEFTCRRLDCSHEHWENCARRKEIVDASARSAERRSRNPRA
jgi:hypothetical protein